jgi:hypothetical protein
MDNLLYYPYINIPKSDWTLRTLLYYDCIGSIVPQNYFYNPNNFEPFMLELVQSELVIPIDPINVLDNPWQVSLPFIEYVNNNRSKLNRRRETFRNGGFRTINSNKFEQKGTRISVDKFDNEVIYQLEQFGLAIRQDGEWVLVEKRTADELMKFLATVIGKKLDYLPATDDYNKMRILLKKPHEQFKAPLNEQAKREIILKELIPFPEQIDLSKLRRFKDNNFELLNAFKNRVEIIALNPTIDEDSLYFRELIAELNNRKMELSAKMNESKFGKIFFGTICGITGAIIGFSGAMTVGAVLGGLPGFANAIHSALQTENITDQTGMKYLALIDKNVRKM